MTPSTNPQQPSYCNQHHCPLSECDTRLHDMRGFIEGQQPEDDELEQLKIDLTGSFEQFRIAQNADSATSIASQMAADMFIRRVFAYADRRADKRVEEACISLRGNLPDEFLRFYAFMQDRTYESVKDEYLGKPQPGAGKYDITSNKLYTAVSTATARTIATHHPKGGSNAS